MSKKPLCPACELEGKRTKHDDSDVVVVFDPAIQIPGTPTLYGHRIAASQIAGLVLDHGMQEVKAWWPYLTRKQVMVCCWWAGLWGPRRFKKVWEDWANHAGAHLWSNCINFPDPPMEGAA